MQFFGRNVLKRREYRSFATIHRRDHRPRSRRLDSCIHYARQRFVAFGIGGAGIQLNQHIPFPDLLPFHDVQGSDAGHIHRGNGLGAPTGDDFAGGVDDDVNMAKNRPGKEHCDEQRQHLSRQAGCWRDRFFLKRESRRQKFRFIFSEELATQLVAFLPVVLKNFAIMA